MTGIPTSAGLEAGAVKPCPFCQSEHISDRHVRDGRQMFCVSCGASAAPTYHGPNNDTMERARESWNRRALSSPAPEPAGRMMVKPLEWVTRPIIGGEDRIMSYDGYYWLSRVNDGFMVIGQDDTGHVQRLGGKTRIVHPTEEEAKAAAQSDFESRIRSALIPPSRAEPVAWRRHGKFKWFYREHQPPKDEAGWFPLFDEPSAPSPQAVAPTGEIAGLVRRLNEIAQAYEAEVAPLARESICEAATALTSISAERDELKAALEAQSPIVASYIAEQSGEGKPISALGDWLRLIAKERKRTESSEARATDLRRKLEEAKKALEPFAILTGLKDEGGWSDDTSIDVIIAYEHSAITAIPLSAFRRARALRESLPTAGSEK